MTFSDFVKMLYNRIGGDISRSEFLVNLTTEIMDESFTAEEHPFVEKSEDMLGRIFNGTKDLPQKDARVIIAHLDKTRFIDYLMEFSDDVLDLIDIALQDNEIEIADNDVVMACTDLFVSILGKCAGGSKVSTVKKLQQPSRMKNDSLYAEDNDVPDVISRKNKVEVNYQLRELYDQTNKFYPVDGIAFEMCEKIKKATIEHRIWDFVQTTAASFSKKTLDDIDRFQDAIGRIIKSYKKKLEDQRDGLDAEQLEKQYEHELYVRRMSDMIASFSKSLKDYVEQSITAPSIIVKPGPVVAGLAGNLGTLVDKRVKLTSLLCEICSIEKPPEIISDSQR